MTIYTTTRDFVVVTCRSVETSFLRPITHYPETGTRKRYQETCTTGFLHGVEQFSNSYQISVPEKIGIELRDTPTGNQNRFSRTGFW